MRSTRRPSLIARSRRAASLPAWKLSAFVLGGAAVVGLGVGVAPAMLSSGPAGQITYGETLSNCRVTDGDTIRCGSERIRLLAIDAPELPGHCKGNRRCAPGDPYASTSSLGIALAGRLTIDRVGEDRYGRTLARVAGAKGDLSCWQLERGQAIYRSDWDNGFRIARTCPRSVV